MRGWMVVAAVAMIGGAWGARAAAAEVHVRVGGEGGAATTLSEAVARTRAAGPGPHRVVVHAGTWYAVGLELTPADSGLTIEAAPGARPVLLGGEKLAGWRMEGGLAVADLPAGRDRQVRLLRIDGKVMERSRWPEEGRLKHGSRFDVPWMSTTGGGWKRKPTEAELTTMKVRPADWPADLLDPASAEVTIYHMWDESTVGVARVEGDTVTLRPAAGHPPGAFGVNAYVVWNTAAGMARPGRWWHDRARNRIVYRPLPGQDLSKVEAVVPTAESVLRLAGTRERPVTGIRVRGLAIGVTNVPLLAAGFAAERFPGAVEMSYAKDVRLEDCIITGVAGHAVNARRGCADVVVARCEVTECGAGGIYVGGERAVIEDNLVRGVGRAYPSAVGIYRGGTDCVVRHNEVADAPYSAINYGGAGNLIENNLIRDCMKVLHDGGAIYIFAGRRCVLRGNVARDIVDTGGYGASAYYLDERSEGCIVERNLSVNVQRPSHNHMAKDNVIRDNVFLYDGDLRLTFPRCSGFALEGNVVYATGAVRVDNAAAVTTWKRNVVFSGAGKVAGVKMPHYSPAGEEPAFAGDTVLADPLFVDWRKGDYRYRDGSPAAKLGLLPIDPDKAGRRPR